MMSWWEFAKCPYFFRKLFSRQVSQNLFFDIKTSYFWAAAISQKFVYFCWSFSCFAVRWQHLLFWLSEHFQKCSTFEKKVVFFNFNICAGACWGCHLYHEKEREKLKLVIEVCLLPSTPEDVKIASEVYFYFIDTFCTQKLVNFYKDLSTKSNVYIDVTFCTQKLIIFKNFCTKSNVYIVVTFCTQILVIAWFFTRIWVQKVTII